ncbi:orotidine 5'-phosphate decarboxylase / HUMPS family protein [Mangrovihabitans endophyticus]|uniref:D-arabino 3-hexulose 6-phosphate aldehyde lyase n=1 Tax=Mangrovihabitans endophyticus TaxID=1751298 RepID=A0A8J3BXZ0_9ACTN|nr:orotidine 5'-phosphate decarboxylase / HUMPS family protein [Mangrovihabitans endophyticus]GGK81626.1 D-arabino 3-hexulose 6-phosphate aldehyde lyase [Mangrovihabitans endophyticus]
MGRSIAGLKRSDLTHGIVQVSLDLKNLDDGLRMAAIAVEAGADWLEIGTPLVMAEGTRAVRALRAEYPDHPLVADLKIMDGGYGEAAMFAEAGADAVVVMGRAHDATVQRVCEAGARYGLLVMGDDMAAGDRVAEARRLEELGVGMVLHHIGHDHRTVHRELGLSPLTDLPGIVAATTVPVQAVGGLSIDQAVGCPAIGAGVVVFGAPLAIDDETSFTIPEGDLPRVLGDAIARVHETAVVS